MEKLSVDAKNQFIPNPMQLFLIGTRDENDQAHFGMFCWLNFCWDGELSVTLCMDGQKATKDHIKRTGVFSACQVTEQLLPLADRLARAKGEEKQQVISALALEQRPGVPVLADSPLCYELQVKQTIPLNGSEIFVCRIMNTLASSALTDGKGGYDLSKAAPVVVSQNRYYGLKALGDVSVSVLPQDDSSKA